MRLLVNSAELGPDDTVLEVGCGTGSMTALLAQEAGAVVTVEIDKGLANIAARELAPYKNISLLCTDVLAQKGRIDDALMTEVVRASAHLGGAFKVVANLPYQVASPLLINLLLAESPPQGVFVTVQLEVAQRMAAAPASKAYGALSIFMQAVGSVRLLRKVNPQSFWPMPQIDSAMVAWQLDSEKHAAIRDKQLLRHAIDLLLGHRRKKIRTCLAHGDGATDYAPLLEKVGIDPDQRGETLGPEQFVRLANLLAEAS